MRANLFIILILVLHSCKVDVLSHETSNQSEVHATSLETNYENWMQGILMEFPNEVISLKRLCLPRSHDAGTYILQHCSTGANACNTQTQSTNITQQLQDGIRFFDIRPVLIDGIYYTQHVTKCHGAGCSGDRIDNMLKQVNSFLSNHAELVILEFSHWCDTGPADESFISLVFERLGNQMIKQEVGDSIPFVQRDLRQILPREDEGKALVLFDRATDTKANRALGIYPDTFLGRKGRYSNSQKFEAMKADQMKKYTRFSNAGDLLFEMSWTLTMKTGRAIGCALNGKTNSKSIQGMAKEANTKLGASIQEMIDSELIKPDQIPNVISVDYCSPFVTRECLKVSKLNLALQLD